MTVSSVQKTINLRPNCLSFPEVLAHSVASIAPTATPAANIALVYASAGNATWLVYLIATIGIALVCRSMNYFTQRSGSSGAIYSYVAQGLGPNAGILCGWALTMAYLLQVGTVAAGCSHYAKLVLNEIGFEASSVVLLAICIGIACYYAFTDIHLSEVLTIFLEIVSIGVILVLAVLVLVRNGFNLDSQQLSLAGATPSGVSFGIVAAILSFVGFEGSMTLGNEAKNSTRSIPRSLVTSTLFAGSFFILMSYTEVLGFRTSNTPLNESGAPLIELARYAEADLLGVAVNAGIMFSLLSCTLALLNSGTRIILSMARHNLYPSLLAKVHVDNRTPSTAILLSSIFVFLLTATMSLFGISDLEIYGYIGTISTYGFLFSYIMLCIAAPVYLSRLEVSNQNALIVCGIAVVFLLIPVVGSVYPVPPYPYNIFPYVFLAYLGVGALIFSRFRSRFSQIRGRMEHDLTEATHNQTVDDD